jgi:hypothetical protein
VVGEVGHASGSFSEVGGCSGTCTQRRKAREAAWHRWSGRIEVRHDRGGLPEGSSGGGAYKQLGGVFFYSRALRGGNAGLRKEGEREVMAQRDGRATGVHVRAARCNNDVAVAAALCGGDAEGVCPYAVGTGELARGWRWTGPRGKRVCASTPCLRGVRLGSWRARWGRT